jgi:DNA-binding response OmpR family regulator
MAPFNDVSQDSEVGQSRILLVEDDETIARMMTDLLESTGYQVREAPTGAAARALVEQVRPDLIILDLVLPDDDGLVLCSVLKNMANAPILICSGTHRRRDAFLSLKLGADDFIAKPFDLDELEARIEAVLRRAARGREAPAAVADRIRVGEMVISQARGTVTLSGQPVHLTPTEYRLLLALSTHFDQVLSRDTLGQIVWGYEELDIGHLIDVHIGRLRHKLRRASRTAPVIITVRGRGYTISADTAETSGGRKVRSTLPAGSPRPRSRESGVRVQGSGEEK